MEELDIEQSAPILLTAEGHKRLKEELAYLTTDKRQEIAERIRESKDHGEFSEDNNELDEIKIEQAMVENRIADLKEILSSADILDPKSISTEEVGIGAKVDVFGEVRNVDLTIQIVASIESDPTNNLISVESPLGAALMGAKVGDVVEFEAPAGLIRYKVKKISAS